MKYRMHSTSCTAVGNFRSRGEVAEINSSCKNPYTIGDILDLTTDNQIFNNSSKGTVIL